VNIFYNGNAKIPLVIPINPTSSVIKTNLSAIPNSVFPGETINLFCSANIAQKAENISNFKIKLNLDKKNFYLLEKISYIKFISDAQTENLKANVTQFDDFLEFELEKTDFLIEKATKIEFEIKLLTLLAEEKNGKIKFEIISDRCYESEVATFDVEIKEICAEDLRLLKFDGFPYLMINENPTKNNIDFLVNLVENDVLSFIVTDICGNVFYEKANLYLENGKHSFILEFPFAASSEYFLTTRSKQLNVTKKVLIIR
jgi:hypothetical protein